MGKFSATQEKVRFFCIDFEPCFCVIQLLWCIFWDAKHLYL